MSSSPQPDDLQDGSPAPLRRSQRPRRSATQPDKPADARAAKGKKASAAAADEDAEDDDGEDEDEMLVMDEDELPSDASSGEEFEVPKAASKKKAAGARKSAGSTSTPATKRKRLSAGSDKKAGGGASSAAEDGEDEVDAQAGGRPKKARTAAAGGGARGGGGGKRAKAAGALEQVTIEKDNIFFNALFSNAALGPIIEEWAEKYEDEEEEALWELVVFLIRASGSSAAIEKEKAVDLDGVPSFVDDLEKEESLGSYPLVSRDKTFRPFHGALTSFVQSLVHHASLSDMLFCGLHKRTEPSALVAVLQAWLFTLSHSPLRSFRHTGTVVALDVMTGLVDALKDVGEELSVASRQKESERRKAGASTKEGKERVKELDRTMKNVHWKKTRLEEYLQEFFNTVFVMRYRDLDEKIRTECVKHLGLWMRTLPGRYLESEYFKYLGWMLDDVHGPTRLETVRALSALYANEAHLSALSTFTERFKARLLEIAFHDVDLGVRTTTIGVLGHVDRAGLLDDERRSQIGLLVFEHEPRVRKAVAGFFDGLWADETQEAVEALDLGSGAKRGGRKRKKTANADDDDDDEAEVGEALRKRAGWKALGALLSRFSQALDEAAAGDADDGSQAVKGLADAVRLRMAGPPKGRVAAAVDSLWEAVPRLRAWEELVDYLGLDHSRPAGEDDDEQDEGDAEKQAERAWKLEEEEEAQLVQVLLAVLAKAKDEADKADDDSTAAADLTRALVKHFPRLLTRYQGEPSQLADVLAIPRLMHLETYLDLRMVTAYETLWDDLTKTYLKSSDFAVLNSALLTIRHLLDTAALANSNAAKVGELETALFGALRDAIDGRDVATAVFDEDELPTLEAACRRIGLLLAFRPAVGAMEEQDDAESPTGWTLLLDLANRGSLGYVEEAQLVDECLESLTRFVFHRARAADTDEAQQSLIEKRAALHELLEEYTIGTQSNAVEAIRRTSFRLLLTLHIFFNPLAAEDSQRKAAQARTLAPALHMALADQVQWRCAGFVQAEIDRYAEELAEAGEALSEDGADGSSDLSEQDDDDDDEGAGKKVKSKAKNSKSSGKKSAAPEEPATLNEAALHARWRFNYLVTTFIQGLLCEVLDLEHAAVVLAHFGRFGPEYDELCKRLAEYVKGAACYGSSAPVASRVVVKALQDASDLFMDGDIEEAQLLALAKVLSSILVVSGPHFRILAKIDSAALVSIHTSLLDSVCKLVGQHTDKGNKPKLRKALVLFKALPPLLAGAVGKDALAIHAHLAEQLEKAGVKPAGDKTWDHQRVYDKRLTTIMSKDSRIAKGARKQVAADEADASLSPPTSPTGATAAKGGKRKRPSQAADDDEGAAKAKKPRPKPKVRPSRAAAHKPADTIEDSDEDDKDAPAAEEEEEEQAPEEEMLNMGDSPIKAPSNAPPPPSSPLSDDGSASVSGSQASVVVTKRRSLAPKT